MSTPQQSGKPEPRVRIAPAPKPQFMKPKPTGEDAKAVAADAPGQGLLAKAAGALRGLASRGDGPMPEPDREGLYTLARAAKVQKVPSPAGTPEKTGYCLVAQGFPLPPGGAAWLVSFDADNDPTAGARPLRSTPSILRTQEQARVRVVALVDEFGRVFAQDKLGVMSPACTPDVQFKRYSGEEGRGCVDLAQQGGRALRVCEFVEDASGISLLNSRVELGPGMRGLSLCAACAAAFVAFWLIPHLGGYTLQGVGVRDAVAKLRGDDVFEAVEGFIDIAEQAQGRPNVLVPGVVSYVSQSLVEAGFTPGIGAADLADAGEGQGGPTGLTLAGVPFLAPDDMGGESGVAGIIQRVTAMVGQAIEATGIPGLSVVATTRRLHADEAPRIRLTRTSKYANMFYIAFVSDQLSAEGARMLLEAEGLFNRLALAQQNQDAEVLQGLGEADAAELDAWVQDQALAAAVPFLDSTLRKASPAPAGAPELEVRLAFARGCECLRLPYRLEYDFTYDVGRRTLIVEMGAMPAQVMPRLTWDADARAWRALDEGARQGMASRYAAFCAECVAAVGFWAGADVEHVCVNARRDFGSAYKMGPEPQEQDLVAQLQLLLSDDAFGGFEVQSNCILSVDFDRRRFSSALCDAQGRARCQEDPFELIGQVPHVFSLGIDGALRDVHPLFWVGEQAGQAESARREMLGEAALGAEPADEGGDALQVAPAPAPSDAQAGRVPETPEMLGAAPHGPFEQAPDAPGQAGPAALVVPDPELDPSPIAPEAQGRLMARRVCDMGIFEGAARKDEASRIMDAYQGQGGLAAIACARDASARTENPLTQAALMSVIEGIATDGLGPHDRERAQTALDDIYGLQPLMSQAAQVVEQSAPKARRLLEQLVERADSNGWFCDSKTRCFRYFDSYAARALYAHRCADDLAGRELRLCADEYYMAHYRLSTLLGDNLDDAEESIAHARRCVELAPGVAASHLRLARAYFSSFDYASEIETLKAALRVIWNPKDLGLALYWLGYAFCMTDEPDAGMACYQRAAAYDHALAKTCTSELSDFAKRRDWQIKAFTEREANLALGAVGVDLGIHHENAEFLMKAASDVLEAGNKELAYKLLGAAGMGMHDDAIAPVLSSLEN